MKVVIVGCGRIAQVRHAPECKANEAIEILGFCDLHTERAQAMCNQYGGHVYNDIETICSDPQVDAVILCNANKDHAAASIQAMRAGKHVLCEKPVAVSLEEAESVARVADETGMMFMAAHNQRFDAVNQAAKVLLQQGRLGKILRFEARFAHGGPEFWSIDSQNTMYFRKSQNALGVLGDLAVHKIDLIHWMLETNFAQVKSICETLDKKFPDGTPIGLEDNAILLVKTESGALGTITASWTNYSGCESSVAFYGQNGCLKAWDMSSAGPCRICVQLKNGDTQEYTFRRREESGVVDAFADAVMQGKPSPVGAWDAIQTMRVIQSALDDFSGKAAN